MARPTYFGDAYLLEDTLTGTRVLACEQLIGDFRAYQPARKFLNRYIADNPSPALPIFHKTLEEYVFEIDERDVILDAWL